MGTVGDLAAVGAVAVLGYVGIKWLSGQDFGGSNGGGSIRLPSSVPATPSPSTQPIIDDFDKTQQGLIDATYIKKELNETLDVGSNVAGGLTKTIYDLATNSIIGDILGTKNAINGITTTAALDAVKKQNNKTIKDSAETTNLVSQSDMAKSVANMVAFGRLA